MPLAPVSTYILPVRLPEVIYKPKTLNDSRKTSHGPKVAQCRGFLLEVHSFHEPRYTGIMERKMETTMLGLGFRGYSPPEVDRERGVYGDLIIIYPKPYSIYLRGTITPKP